MSSQSELELDVAVFRRFNRMYTKVIGTLNEGLLDSGFSLAEARVLYELAQAETAMAKEIAEGLEMDPGYLSRLLAKFERDGLLRRKVSKQDGRAEVLVLTARGRAAAKKLSDRSNAQAAALLQGVSPAERTEVLESMRSIERLLGKERRETKAFVLRPHRVGDMGWVVYREGVGYAEQYGWDETFEAMVATIVGEFVAKFDAKRERCWIAEADGQSVGHVFLVKHPSEAGTAKLRLLFVEPSARGMGLGDALVTECVRFARGAGYKRVVLWTQSLLTAAHRIYERAGFRLVKEEPHRSFGHELVGQEWELELN